MPPPGELPKTAILTIGTGNRRDNFVGSASRDKANRHDFGRFAAISPFFLKSPLAIIRRLLPLCCPRGRGTRTMIADLFLLILDTLEQWEAGRTNLYWLFPR